MTDLERTHRRATSAMRQTWAQWAALAVLALSCPEVRSQLLVLLGLPAAPSVARGATPTPTPEAPRG